MIDPSLKIYPWRLDIDRIEDMSPEPALPIDAATLRSHCHALTTDDTMLEFYQRAAIAGWERYVDKTLIARPHRWVLKDFNRFGRYDITLPRGTTQSISKIEYVTGGATVTLYGPSSDLSPTGEDFQENLLGDSGVIMPRTTWPSVDSTSPAGVIIYFTAGYSEGEVPNDIKELLMFIVSTLFEHRGASDLDGEALNLKVFQILSGLLGQHHEPTFA